MGLGLRRADLRRLAEEKLADAELLLAHHRYANSYYLAGYAIEIALKGLHLGTIRRRGDPGEDLRGEDLHSRVQVSACFGGPIRFAEGEGGWRPTVRGKLRLGCAILVGAGQLVVEALDASGTAPRAAVWVQNGETDRWKLWLVPKSVPADERDFYRGIAEIVSKNRDRLGGFDAADAKLVTDTHPAISGLGRLIRISGLGSARFTENIFDGYYLSRRYNSSHEHLI